MRASDLATGDTERKATEEALIHTELVNAVNAGIVANADKSGQMIKSDPFERRKESPSPRSSRTGSPSGTDGKSGASVAQPVGKKASSQAAEGGISSGNAVSSIKASHLSRSMRLSKASVKSLALSKALQDTEFEGVDDAYYKAKAGTALGKRAVKAFQKKHVKNGFESLGEKRYRRPKSPQEVQRQLQSKRNQLTSRAIHAEKTAQSAQASTQTATALSQRLAATLTHTGGGGAVAALASPLAIFIPVLLIFLLFMGILGGIFGNSDDVGGLTGVDAEIAEYLLDLDFSKSAVAGVIGNMRCESADPANTNSYQDPYSGTWYIACGMFQYTSVLGSGSGLYYTYMDWCNANGKTWSDASSQLEFSFSSDSPGYIGSYWGHYDAYSGEPGYESRFSNDCYRTVDAFKGADDVDLATYSFMACFEKPQAGMTHLDQRLEAARSALAAMNSGGGAGGWTFPLPDGWELSSDYGYRSFDDSFHKGVDLAIAGGTPIYAAHSGTVTFCGWYGTGGYAVIIDHGDGLQSIYMHQSRTNTYVGAEVSAGDTIGYVGNTGDSYGNHLHFQIEQNGTAVNPHDYLSF